MKRKNACGKFVVLICFALSLVACSYRAANESSQSGRLADNPSTSASTVSTTNSPSSSQLDPVDQTQSGTRAESAGNPIQPIAPVERSSSSSSLSEVSSPQSSVKEAEPGVSITVKKEELMDGKEKVISDEAQIQKILEFAEGMFKSDFTSPPSTGGVVMSVFITRDGVTEGYSFFEDEVDGYGLAKNDQDPDVRNTWYFADAEAFSYLLNLLQ
ncbi:MAG: hypothetical protein ACERKO_04035 [Acetanaerobacterium sp.]